MEKLIILFFFICKIGIAQNNFKQIATISVNTDFYTTDNQSNIYIVVGDELQKYNKSGVLLYKYSNKNLGKIDFVDASNMMRLLVYYKNFLQIVFLDNTLTLKGQPISLEKLDFQQTLLVCSSYDNGFWNYNQQNMELVRIDKSLNKTLQTGNLNTLLSTKLLPNYLLEYNNKVYLNNPTTGLLIFDIYGTYFKTIPIKDLTQFQPINDLIFYNDSTTIKSYNIKTTEIKEFELPTTDFINFRLENEFLILQNTNTITVYSSKK